MLLTAGKPCSDLFCRRHPMAFMCKRKCGTQLGPVQSVLCFCVSAFRVSVLPVLCICDSVSWLLVPPAGMQEHGAGGRGLPHAPGTTAPSSPPPTSRPTSSSPQPVPRQQGAPRQAGGATSAQDGPGGGGAAEGGTAEEASAEGRAQRGRVVRVWEGVWKGVGRRVWKGVGRRVRKESGKESVASACRRSLQELNPMVSVHVKSFSGAAPSPVHFPSWHLSLLIHSAAPHIPATTLTQYSTPASAPNSLPSQQGMPVENSTRGTRGSSFFSFSLSVSSLGRLLGGPFPCDRLQCSGVRSWVVVN